MNNICRFKKRFVPITIGVSGHIDISAKDADHAANEFRELIEALMLECPHTPIQILTSLAVGCDRIATKVFLDLRSKLKLTNPEIADRWELIVILPMQQEVFKADFEDTASEFETFLKEADATIVMPLSKDASKDDIRVPGEKRNYQYQDATRYISVHADILVAFWDGQESKKIGGTHDAIRMRLLGHAVTDRIHYSPLAVSASRLVHHIMITRQTAPEEILTDNSFVKNDKYSTEIKKTLLKFSDSKEIDKFNRNLLKFVKQKDFEKSLRYFFYKNEFLDDIEKIKLNHSSRLCLELYASADALSIHGERNWRKLTTAIYSIGLATAVLLPVAIEDVFLPWTMFGYVTLLALAFGAFFWIQKSRLENRHVESRALAEFLRIQIVWLFSGISENRERTFSDSNPHYFPPNVSTALLGQQLLNIGWIGRVLTSLTIFQSTDRCKISPNMDSRIVEDWIDGQKVYFKKSQIRSERAAYRIRLFSKIFVFFGLFSAFGAIAMSHYEIHFEILHQLFVISAASFPIMSVILENFSENLGFETQAKINERLLDVFENAEKLMKNRSASERVINDLIIEAGKEAVSEAMMWYFLRRSKPTKVSI